MRGTFLLFLVDILTAVLISACAPSPSFGADGPPGPDVKPVAPPVDMVGQWRLEVTDGTSTRTSVHNFMKDGRVVVDVQLNSPNLKVTDQVKRVIIRVEKDRVTWVDLSHTSAEGVEDVLMPERRQPRTYQIQIKGDELYLSELDEKGNPVPDLKPTVLKRVKE